MLHSDAEMLRSMHNMWEETQPPKPKNRKERRAEKAKLRKRKKNTIKLT